MTNVDITTNGMLSVTLDAAGHTGTDDLTTNTIPITASAGANVCGRTAQVRDSDCRPSPLPPNARVSPTWQPLQDCLI